MQVWRLGKIWRIRTTRHAALIAIARRPLSDDLTCLHPQILFFKKSCAASTDSFLYKILRRIHRFQHLIPCHTCFPSGSLSVATPTPAPGPRRWGAAPWQRAARQRQLSPGDPPRLLDAQNRRCSRRTSQHPQVSVWCECVNNGSDGAKKTHKPLTFSPGLNSSAVVPVHTHFLARVKFLSCGSWTRTFPLPPHVLMLPFRQRDWSCVWHSSTFLSFLQLAQCPRGIRVWSLSSSGFLWERYVVECLSDRLSCRCRIQSLVACLHPAVHLTLVIKVHLATIMWLHLHLTAFDPALDLTVHAIVPSHML